MTNQQPGQAAEAQQEAAEQIERAANALRSAGENQAANEQAAGEQSELSEQADSLQNELNRLQQQQSAPRGGYGGATGHATFFMNYSHFYPGAYSR